MNDESIVYGYIKNTSGVSDTLNAQIVNRKALIQLPTLDACSILSREIFSTPSGRSNSDRFQSSIIHFAAAYDGIEYEWGLWVAKFESLLQQMCWNTVVVHLETELSGVHTFTWDSGDNAHIPSENPLNIRCEWQHDVGVYQPRA